MLTKDDISQIRNVVEEVLETKLEQKLEQKLKPIRKDIQKIKSDLDITIRSFDKDITNTKTRVDKIESFLHLPSPSL